MPSNKELTDDILALDPEAKVEGLTNPKLATLLKQLRAAEKTTDTDIAPKKSTGFDLIAPAETDPPTTTAAVDQSTPEPKVEEPKVEEPKVEEPKVEEPKPAAAEPTNVHRVAEGKSITSKRGVLGPGDEVRPEYFVGGESVLADLIEKGLVK